MKHQTFDTQSVTQYLLGALPEAEAERFDELSFTDDEFADTLKVAEKELVDAYVQGELSGAASEQFRSYYLSSPLRHEKVRFAQAFQGWAEQGGVKQIPHARPEGRRKEPWEAIWFSALNKSRSPRLAWGFAVAGLLLFGVGGLLVFQNLRLRQQMTQTQVKHDQVLQREQELKKEIEAQRSINSQTEQELASLRDERAHLEQKLAKSKSSPAMALSSPARVVSFVLPSPLRGGGTLPTVSIPARTDLVSMHLQLDTADYPAYTAALIDPINNQTLWRSAKRTPRTKGGKTTITLSYSPRFLKPQNYRLQLSGVSPTGVTEIVGDYSFKVVK